MSRIILSKTPCIIEVQSAFLERGIVEIFLCKEGSTMPTLPQYTLSKFAPATNVDRVFFDVSPYINEFVTNKEYIANVSTNNVLLPYENYCKIKVKSYKVVAGATILLNTFESFGFKGYIYNSNNILQPTFLDFLLDQKTYYYYYNSANPTAIPFGDITLYNTYTGPVLYLYIYTDLKTGSSYTYDIITSGFKKIYRVYPAFAANGNKLEIVTDNGVLIATYYFRPIEECRYSPVVLDFVNKYGAWQREFLFKNSTDSINVESQSYKNYRANPSLYYQQESLLTSFNTNGSESIKTNTGWVNEDFKDNLKQLLLSDSILINNRPATITTKQIELQKNINNKLINYALDFTFSNPII